MPWVDADRFLKQVEDSLEHLYPSHYDQRPTDISHEGTKHAPNAARITACEAQYLDSFSTSQGKNKTRDPSNENFYYKTT